MSNMFDEDEVSSYIERIEGLESEIATSKSEHMNFAKKKQEEIKEVMDDAKENGVPRKILKGILDKRKLQGKIDDIEKDLEEDFKPLYRSLAEVFANYQPMKQTSMFDADGNGEDEEGFDPDFVDPADQQEREQEEGEKVLNRE